MSPVRSWKRRAWRQIGRAAACAAFVAACRAGPGDPAVTPAPAGEPAAPLTAEEIQIELENLGYEISDLESYLAAAPVEQPPAAAADPATLIAQARRAREAAEELAASGDQDTAAESLGAAALHIEQVKRALALAEEWGEEVVD